MEIKAKNFFETEFCKSKKFCNMCRLSVEFREAILFQFETPNQVNFECPNKIDSSMFIEEKVPSKIEIIKIFGYNFKNITKEFIKGHGLFTNKYTAKERLDICKSCKFFISNKKCLKCSCFICLKKRIKASHCPIGKW